MLLGVNGRSIPWHFFKGDKNKEKLEPHSIGPIRTIRPSPTGNSSAFSIFSPFFSLTLSPLQTLTPNFLILIQIPLSPLKNTIEATLKATKTLLSSYPTNFILHILHFFSLHHSQQTCSSFLTSSTIKVSDILPSTMNLRRCAREASPESQQPPRPPISRDETTRMSSKKLKNNAIIFSA